MGDAENRAVTAQLGAVLLLGFIVLALTTYQATIVPDANRATEFDHSQQVIDEMQTLQADIHNAMSTGDDIESTVTLGTDYESRMLAINPPPAAGRLTTTEAESIATDSDELDVGSICGQDGTTRAIQYEADYSEYRNAPTITYESSVLYLEFDDEYLIESEQAIVSGDQLSLYPLEGEIDKNGVERESVRFQPGQIETSEEELDEFNLTVPTEIPADQWEDDSNLLADEMGADGRVKEVVDNETADGIDIRLESDTYDIQCRPTGVDTVSSSGPAEDGSGSGESGGNDSEDSSVGNSGESDFDDTKSATISSTGGVWTGITNVDSVYLVNPKLSPVQPSEDKMKTKTKYIRLVMTLQNDSSEYVFLIGEESNQGLAYDEKNSQWTKDDVDLYERSSNGKLTHMFKDEPLDENSLNDWLDGESLNVLNKTNYDDPSDVKDGLSDVRSVLNTSEEAEIYITDMHGRTEVRLE